MIITVICFDFIDSPNQRSAYHHSENCEDTKMRKEKAIVSISIMEDVLFFPRGTLVIDFLTYQLKCLFFFRRSGELFMLGEFVEA